MTILSKTTAKTFFESGDVPSGTDFANWIDSCVFIPANVTAGSFPFVIETESTVSSTVRPFGTFGAQMLNTTTTASAAGLFEFVTASSFGGLLGGDTTQASALSRLGITNAGRQLAQANTTASAQNAIGVGAVGRQIVEANTTASALSLLRTGRVLLLSENTVSAQSIDFAVSGYAVYEIFIDHIEVEDSATANSIFLRHSFDNGTTFENAAASYNSTILVANGRDATARTTALSDTILNLSHSTDDLTFLAGTAGSIWGVVRVYDASASNRRTMYDWQLNYLAGDTARSMNAVIGAARAGTARRTDAIRIGIGTFSAIATQLRVYGIERR